MAIKQLHQEQFAVRIAPKRNNFPASITLPVMFGRRHSREGDHFQLFIRLFCKGKGKMFVNRSKRSHLSSTESLVLKYVLAIRNNQSTNKFSDIPHLSSSYISDVITNRTTHNCVPTLQSSSLRTVEVLRTKEIKYSYLIEWQWAEPLLE